VQVSSLAGVIDIAAGDLEAPLRVTSMMGCPRLTIILTWCPFCQKKILYKKAAFGMLLI
jgi:hypothetical protein